MAFVPVDISKIKLDQTAPVVLQGAEEPDYRTQLVPDAPAGGYVPVDISKIQLDNPAPAQDNFQSRLQADFQKRKDAMNQAPQQSSSDYWRGILPRDPNKDYGAILPFSIDKTTGKKEFAAPEMIRSIPQGIADLYQGAEIAAATNGGIIPPITPDALGVVGSIAMMNPTFTKAPKQGAPNPIIPDKYIDKALDNKIVTEQGSGVSINNALGGIPDVAATIPQGVKNRVVGAKALGREELDAALLSYGDNTSNLYKAVDATGASLKPNAAQAINNNVLAAIDATQINPAASPKTIGAVKELYNRVTVGKINPITGEVKQAPISVSELDGYRKLLSNISGEDAVVANKVRSAIDSSLDSLSPEDFNGGGVQAAKLLTEARASAAKGFKLTQIADIIKKADGNTIAIKRGFKNLIDKKDWERGFNPDEIKAIKDAAQYGVGETLERGLGTFGLDLGKTKNVALPVLTGGSVGLGVPGGVPLVAAGTVTRQTGKLAARGKAQNVLNTIQNRK